MTSYQKIHQDLMRYSRQAKRDAYRKIHLDLIRYARQMSLWDEDKHPRADDGKFGSGPGDTAAANTAPTPRQSSANTAQSEITASRPEERHRNESFDDEINIKTDGGVLRLAANKHAPTDWSVTETYVDEDKRGQGIATRLVEHAKANLEGTIGAAASSDNSVGLFWKAGFRLPDGGTIEDAKQRRAEDSSVNLIYGGTTPKDPSPPSDMQDGQASVESLTDDQQKAMGDWLAKIGHKAAGVGAITAAGMGPADAKMEITADDQNVILLHAGYLGSDEVSAHIWGEDHDHDAGAPGPAKLGSFVMAVARAMQTESKHAKREAAAERIPADAKVIAFKDSRGRRLLIAPAVRADRQSAWQLSNIQADGTPSGHVNPPTLEAAIHRALGISDDHYWNEQGYEIEWTNKDGTAAPFKKSKYAKQLGLWDEEKHPRGDGGKFAETPKPPTPDPPKPPAARTGNAWEAKRNRKQPTIVFDSPIKGPSGWEIHSYEWKHEEYEDVDESGESFIQKISNWDESETNEETGRQVVHQFGVLDINGQFSIVSLESALTLLGYMAKSKAAGVGQIRKLTTALKSRAMAQIAVDHLEDFVARMDAAVGEGLVSEELKAECKQVTGFDFGWRGSDGKTPREIWGSRVTSIERTTARLRDRRDDLDKQVERLAAEAAANIGPPEKRQKLREANEVVDSFFEEGGRRYQSVSAWLADKMKDRRLDRDEATDELRPILRQLFKVTGVNNMGERRKGFLNADEIPESTRFGTVTPAVPALTDRKISNWYTKHREDVDQALELAAAWRDKWL